MIETSKKVFIPDTCPLTDTWLSTTLYGNKIDTIGMCVSANADRDVRKEETPVMYLVAILFSLTLLMTAPVMARDIVAVMVEDAPVVDGRADDSAWSHVEPVTVV